MGKRKSAKKPGAGKVKAKPLDKSFKCLFCQHVNTVLCKMDRANRLGRLDCKDCLQSFQAAITALDEPIDLYSQWIDACEEVNVPTATTSTRPAPAAARVAAKVANRPSTRGANDDEDDDEDLPEVPGARRARTPDGDDDEDDADVGNNNDDDGEDDDLPAASRPSASEPSDMGYTRKENSKLDALLESKRSRATVVDDEEDDD